MQVVEHAVCARLATLKDSEFGLLPPLVQFTIEPLFEVVKATHFPFCTQQLLLNLHLQTTVPAEPSNGQEARGDREEIVCV